MTSQGPWPGRFVWHDFMTTDGAAAQSFYTSLFGWQVMAGDVMGQPYRMILCGPGPIGGIMQDQNIPVSHWMPYIGVDDVDATAEKIQAHGGGVCVPPTDIPKTGRFAVVNDPTGAWFCIYKGLPESQGFDPDLPVPGRVCWNELLTQDPAAAQAFYTDVFGWQDTPTDMGEAGVYHMQMLGDKQAAGMMQAPMPDMPSCWSIYFFVEDLAAATQKAKDLGATALMEGMPIPGVGSFALLKDPMGAMFSLFTPLPGQSPC